MLHGPSVSEVANFYLSLGILRALRASEERHVALEWKYRSMSMKRLL